MARGRGKSKRSRRKPAFKILNALEALVYTGILTTGIAGTSPWGFITGKGDLGYKLGIGAGTWEDQYKEGTLEMTGEGAISLKDIMKEPGLAVAQMSTNFGNNLAPMAIAAFTTGVTFNVGRRLLRRPINNINRNIMKPMLGAGIKL